jgi:hypothetical protein
MTLVVYGHLGILGILGILGHLGNVTKDTKNTKVHGSRIMVMFALCDHNCKVEGII